MLRQITWDQFIEWMAYAEVEPFGDRRADYRTASIICALVNANRDTKKHPNPFKPKDFLPAQTRDFWIEFDRTFVVDRKQSPMQQRKVMEQWIQAWTGVVPGPDGKPMKLEPR